MRLNVFPKNLVLAFSSLLAESILFECAVGIIYCQRIEPHEYLDRDNKNSFANRIFL